MTSQTDRSIILELVTTAKASGTSYKSICARLGLHRDTVRRWFASASDGRIDAKRPKPSNALTEQEREHILEVCNRPEYAALQPEQIVVDCIDNGEYIGSESSVYRVLKEAKQLKHRGRVKKARKHKKPTSHCATGPNQVWTWDITWLPSRTRGLYFYLYLILDVYSRKIVGWEVFAAENAENAALLIEKTMWAEKRIGKNPLVLHSDNGSPMKAHTFRTKLADLNITSSFSRPRVSNDNPYSEALFRTLKYCIEFPFEDGFATLLDAQQWCLRFHEWYNTEHRHSGIKFVTPEQRHDGKDIEILQQRVVNYELARKKNPNRWTGSTRNWNHEDQEWLNPHEDTKKNAKLKKVG